jgi:hypothetical protein
MIFAVFLVQFSPRQTNFCARTYAKVRELMQTNQILDKLQFYCSSARKEIIIRRSPVRIRDWPPKIFELDEHNSD